MIMELACCKVRIFFMEQYCGVAMIPKISLQLIGRLRKFFIAMYESPSATKSVLRLVLKTHQNQVFKYILTEI